jgi:hypothetical protein
MTHTVFGKTPRMQVKRVLGRSFFEKLTCILYCVRVFFQIKPIEKQIFRHTRVSNDLEALHRIKTFHANRARYFLQEIESSIGHSKPSSVILEIWRTPKHQTYNKESALARPRVQPQMLNKHTIVLYVDQEVVEKTRSLGFNLSKTFENYLKHLLMQFSQGNSMNNTRNNSNIDNWWAGPDLNRRPSARQADVLTELDYRPVELVYFLFRYIATSSHSLSRT